MHKFMEYICGELEELERKASKDGRLSLSEIEYADKLAHIKKDLLSAEEMWENSDYSMANGGSYARNGQTGGNRGENSRASYARGRGRNAKRDSMGRYSREGSSYRGNTYENGYSMAEDDFRADLEELIQDAPNEQIKMKLQRMIQDI